jgi:hypothetical protein
MNTHSLSSFLLRKVNIATATLVLTSLALTSVVSVYAASTSNFAQTINAGTLSVDIVNSSYVTVGSPSVTMSAKTFSFNCLSGGSASTGTFGAAEQLIYIKNPDAADNGWTVSLAGSATTAVWDSAGTDYDFNDAGGSGCTDGADADDFGGQMTVDPSVGTLATGACASCATTAVSKGTSAAFVEGTTNSITLLTGASGSNDIGDWKLTGVSISQTIPAEQPAASDYDVDLTLSVLAS